MSDLIFREFRPDDVSSVQELSAKVFHDARPKEYFVWKFLDNPAGRGISIVAEDSGQTVGHVSLVPTRLRVGNEVVPGAQGVDSMIHPNYPGMFVAMFRACMELAVAKGVEIGYGSPNQNSYPALVHMLNWDHTGEIPQWLRILNTSSPTSLASRPLTKKVMLWGMHLLPMGHDAPSGIQVRRERPTDEELVSLAGQTGLNVRARTCRIERSTEWFKWRFNAASQRRYQWFSAHRDGDLKAWAVFGLNDWGEIPIIDMSGADPNALEAVVSTATRRAKELGLTRLTSVRSDNGAVPALKSCGYFQHGSTPLVVKSFTNRILNANIHLHSSWHVTSQDLDSF